MYIPYAWFPSTGNYHFILTVRCLEYALVQKIRRKLIHLVWLKNLNSSKQHLKPLICSLSLRAKQHIMINAFIWHGISPGVFFLVALVGHPKWCQTTAGKGAFSSWPLPSPGADYAPLCAILIRKKVSFFLLIKIVPRGTIEDKVLYSPLSFRCRFVPLWALPLAVCV